MDNVFFTNIKHLELLMVLYFWASGLGNRQSVTMSWVSLLESEQNHVVSAHHDCWSLSLLMPWKLIKILPRLLALIVLCLQYDGKFPKFLSEIHLLNNNCTRFGWWACAQGTLCYRICFNVTFGASVECWFALYMWQNSCPKYTWNCELELFVCSGRLF